MVWWWLTLKIIMITFRQWCFSLYGSFINIKMWCTSYLCQYSDGDVCHVDPQIMNDMKCTSEGGLYTYKVVEAYLRFPSQTSACSWLASTSGWSCGCQNCAYEELCYLCLSYCYISPFTFLVGVSLVGNFNLTQHITRDSGGGGDTVLFTRITLCGKFLLLFLVPSAVAIIFTHMVLEDWKNGI